MADFLDLLSERVLLCDGAMGSRVQAHDLDVAKDFWGKENCTEILNRSRPDVVREIHMGYLAAGADVIETNSFGGSPVTLGEFDLAEDAFDLNREAAELAREAVAEFGGDGRQRFVLGSVGPGTRLPSLGHIDYPTLEDAFAVQCAGLVAGEVDGLLVETCQDPLQMKAAVNGAKRALGEAGRDLPIIVQVTVEGTGTLLVGTDIAAAATVVRALDVAMMGINCATGPQEMAEHVKWLGDNWPGPISVQPNAGLPELIDGRPVYPLSPAELAQWQARFIEEDGIAMVGGCCGTTVEHIAALDAMLVDRSNGRRRPARARRTVHWEPALASLYGQVTLRQERAYLSIGERCNANGSKRFRELQARQDWDGCVEMGRAQVKEGSNALDLCTAFVGRDEGAEMVELVSRLRGAVTAPLVIDSTEYPVLEAALGLYGGKPVINSINFEDGEAPAEQRLMLAKRHGAAVIALTIDEAGMAKESARKVEVAKRLYEFAVGRHRLEPSDLLIDPLTFTICTGNEDDRKLGLWTLDAIERLAAELPECQIILGLSNVSFGLNPAARQVLNSVFLDHALKRGMTGAILHYGRMVPLHKIPPQEVEAAEDLIYDRRRDGHDPLHAFIALFQDRTAAEATKAERSARVEERLKQRIIDGDRIDLEADLEEALARYPPLDIINTFLIDGMKVVGDLFGAGKMQLPFVLQSAETMKAAVAYLEPKMDRVEGHEKGTVVLATVRGDVHDIGKNLVDIILTNNGYKVVNLGIKQPISNILAAAEEHRVDAIGMSGLLVKSTVVMRENLEEMSRQELRIPVLLGGAALTRAYVEQDCRDTYDCGRLAYARDAFDGLDLMAKVVSDGFDAHVEERARKRAARPSRRRRPEAPVPQAADGDWARGRRAELGRGVRVPAPPFWGPRVIDQVAPKALTPFLNERMLYQFHWGYRKDGRSLKEYMAWAKKELRPKLKRLIDTCVEDHILAPKAGYGYWKAAAEGDALILFAEDGVRELARFELPRERDGERKCIADYVRDVADGPEARDVVALQVVTVGQRASDVAREWFADDRYQDYVFLHGLGVEMAEALAEYVHKRVRAELDIAQDDARDREALLRQGYRGSRYSFGYPACPRLEDQTQILGLLDAGRIGVSLSEEFQLHPEQSTSAIVLHHPAAKYFSV
ncbi:MAG: methionine synthase [Kiloniellales bacterium]